MKLQKNERKKLTIDLYCKFVKHYYTCAFALCASLTLYYVVDVFNIFWGTQTKVHSTSQSKS